MLKKVIGFILCAVIIASLAAITVSADFELGDFTYSGEITDNPTLNGWCSNGREGVSTDLDLDTVKSAKELRIEFSEPIEGNLVFIMQSNANWWDQKDGVQNGTNIIVIDLTGLPSWADFLDIGDQVNFYIGDWGTDYWEDIKIVSAVLITGEAYVAPDAGDSEPAEVAAWVPKDFKIGSGKTIITAVDFDPTGFNETGTDGNYDARPEMKDLGGPQTESDNIGWIGAGEWVQYTVNVENSGSYGFNALLASDADPTGNIEVYVDDVLVGASSNSLKRGWQAYDLFPVGTIDLSAGTHVIKTVFPNGGLNFSALEINEGGILAVEPEVPEVPVKAAVVEVAAPVEEVAAPSVSAPANPRVGDNALIFAVLLAMFAGALIITKRISKNRA